MPVREDLRLDSLCTVDGEGGVHCISRGKRPVLHKMRRYGPTVQVREEVRLDNLCTGDCECAAHCVSQ